VSVYDIVTEKILAQLEAGVLPWRQPWTSSNPKNLVSKREYQGINVLLLSLRGYASPWWVTLNQANYLGGKVKRGEKGSMIVFYRMIENKKRRKANGDPETFPLFTSWTVFNLEQTEGLNAPESNKDPVLSIEAAEELSNKYRANSGPGLGVSDHAAYVPSTDTVVMPPRDSFANADLYYSTLFHEYGHSTGHPSRLNRVLEVAKMLPSENYSKEELIAELSAAFTCGRLGITRSQEASASYLQGWIKTLRGDSRLIVSAASAAEKATRYIFGEREGVAAPEVSEEVTA